MRGVVPFDHSWADDFNEVRGLLIRTLSELAARYVSALGGVDHVVELAQAAFDDGDFRWAATLLDHAVFVEENHSLARDLYADTLEQLGYGSENGTWRNFFLSGASELRHGNFGTPTPPSSNSILAQLTPEHIFDALAISVDGPRAWSLDLTLIITFSDLGTGYRITLRNGVLISTLTDGHDTAPLRITLTKPRMLLLVGGDLDSPGLESDGDRRILDQLLEVLDRPDSRFNIITP